MAYKGRQSCLWLSAPYADTFPVDEGLGLTLQNVLGLSMQIHGSS